METGNYKPGTTLVEILTVVAVIMILAGLVVGIGASIDSHSKEKAVKATFSLLEAALEEYRDFTGSFPLAADPNPNVNCETLYAELNRIPGSREVLEKISEKVIKNGFNPTSVPPIYEIYDPWGTVLDYTYNPGDSCARLISAGPNRIFNDGDDITNR